VARPTYVLGQQAQPAAGDPDEELAKKLVTQLEIESKQIAIDEAKSRRLWAAVAGLATITTALVGVLTLVYARRR